MAQVALDPGALDELYSVETRGLLDVINKLSPLGIGSITNPPQIIVVGDRSSGRSSVFEAISHVKIPVGSRLGTHFATELVLRNGSQRRIKATIRFHDDAKPAHEITKGEDISKVIAAVSERMGLPDSNPGFSKDVLCLEVEGPDLHPLTLVDLPGIFHAATAEESAEEPGEESADESAEESAEELGGESAEVRTTIMELIDSYMAKENSIILAVVSADNQLAAQTVLQEAARYDPSRERTFGVITKPDLLHPGSSDELEYLQVVRGRETAHKLQLGWHVLRNLPHDGTSDAGAADSRDVVERKFFESGSWASIPVAHRGASALRKRLGQIIHHHIKKSVPGVLEEVQEKLAENQAELTCLGQARTSAADMRAYLVDIAARFERLVRDGIRGHYNDPFFGGFDGTDRKLRSHLRRFNRAIRHILLVQGSTQNISSGPSGTARPQSIPLHLKEFLDEHPYDLPMPEPITWSEMATQLERQAAANQGTELPGYANTNLIVQLFQRQSKPWEDVARLHLENVTAVVKGFVDQAFEHVAGPMGTCSTTSAILSTCVDPFFDERQEILENKLQELLRPFQEGYALPLDADFQEAMDYDSSDGEKKALERRRSDFGTGRVIEKMQTFYDMALRTFTDNLINLALESCLIQELPGILTPKAVSGMDDARLAELAAESEMTRARRTQLHADIKLLKQGLDQCRRYRPRVVTSVKRPMPSPVKQQGIMVISSAQPNAGGLSKVVTSNGQQTSRVVAPKTAQFVTAPTEIGQSARSTPPEKTTDAVPKVLPPRSNAQTTANPAKYSAAENGGLLGNADGKAAGSGERPSSALSQVPSQAHPNSGRTGGTPGGLFNFAVTPSFGSGSGATGSTETRAAVGGLGSHNPRLFAPQSTSAVTPVFGSNDKGPAKVQGEKTSNPNTQRR